MIIDAHYTKILNGKASKGEVAGIINSEGSLNGYTPTLEDGASDNTSTTGTT